MDASRRKLTEFPQLQVDSSSIDEHKPADSDRHSSLFPPELNVVPPPIEEADDDNGPVYEEMDSRSQASNRSQNSSAGSRAYLVPGIDYSENDSGTSSPKKKDSSIKHMLNLSSKDESPKSRPKLSLRTIFPHNSEEGSSSRLFEGALSPNPTLRSRSRVRRLSTDDGSVTENEFFDTSLLSARVLSYIGADEVDEFEEIQNDLKHGIGEDGSWLPQPNELDVEANTSGSDTEHDENVENDSVPGHHIMMSQSNSPVITSSDAIAVGRSQPVKDEKFNVTATDSPVEDESDTVFFTPEELHRGNRSNSSPKLYGNSLGLISPINPIRLKFAHILLTKAYRTIYFSLLSVFTGLLVSRTYNPPDYAFFYKFSAWPDYPIFIFSVFFSLSDLMKIIAFGFWDDSQMFAAHGRAYMTLVEQLGIIRFCNNMKEKYNFTFLNYLITPKKADDDRKKLLQEREESDFVLRNESLEFIIPRAFMRSSWNRIDFTSSICFWIGLLLSIKDYDAKNGIRVFKSLAILRILRLLDTDTVYSSVFRALKVAMPQLINVSTMLVYFWILFGILGVQSFRGSLRRNCVWYNPDDPTDTFTNEGQFCGGQLDPLTLKPSPYIFEDGTVGPIAKGFFCPANSKCVSGQNPYNGRTSFDNIIYAMEMVFVIMSANTFTDIMYETMDTDSMAAAIFFIVATFFLTIWLMNLLIAVLVSSFELANEQFRKDSLVRKNKKKYNSLFTRLTSSYWNYVEKRANENEFSPLFSRCHLIYAKIEPFFILLIAVDLIWRSIMSADIAGTYMEIFVKFNFAICTVLLFESLLRLILHWNHIWRFMSRINYVFDLIIAISAFIISAVKLFGTMGRAYDWLSILQIIRFYRVVYFFKFSSDLWKRVLSNGGLIWDLSSFYFFFTFLVSLIMSVSFENIIPQDQISEVGFGMFSLSNTFISLFIIASTENWTNILYALQQYSPNISSSFFATVFLIIWFILSNSVMMNIFIAVIAASMDVEEKDKRPLQIQHYLKYVYPRKIREYTDTSLMERLQRKIFRKKFRDDSKDFKHFLIRGSAIMNMAQNTPELTKDFHKLNSSEEERPSLWELFVKPGEAFLSLRRLKIFASNPFYKKAEIVFTENQEDGEKTVALQLDDHEEDKLAYLRSHPSFNYSYFILSPHHLFRKFCQRLVPPSYGKRTDGINFYEDYTNTYSRRAHFKRFERDIFLFLITCTTIALIVTSCLCTPLYRMDKNMQTWSWPTYWDCAMLCIFSIEFIVKTVADGFIYTPNAYMRNSWNIIDLFVLISLWINFIAYLQNDVDISRVFKGLTALRALRLLNISNLARETFSLVVFDGIRKILEAAFISMTLLLPFSIWGLTLFRGRLGTCNDGNMSRDECYNEFTQTIFQWDIVSPRAYGQPYLNFESFPTSLRSLYEIISLEGWTDLLQNIMNSTGVGTVTSPFATPGNAVFLMLFNFLSMIFILNIFISFIISNHAKTTGSAYLTIEEKSWSETKKLLKQANPRRVPKLQNMTTFRKFFYSLASEKKNFYYAFSLQMVLYTHIIMLLCRTFDRPNSKISYEDIFFMFSTTTFLLHEIFLVFGEGFFFYISSKWNAVRLSIVVISFSLSAVGFKVRNDALIFGNINDLFRLMIFLFIIPQNNTLLELIQTAAASWPSIFALTYTWGILFLVYAIALNQIFGLTKLGPNTTDNLNFRTIAKSLIVLFRCSFGEGWNYIMADLTLEEPFCFVSADSGYSDCGSMQYAYELLMSWNIVSMYIFLNMFISVVVTNFSYVYRRGVSESPIDRNEILKFVDAWAKFDREGYGKINSTDLPLLMHSFDGPLSFKIWEGSFNVHELVKNYMSVNLEDPYDVEVDLEGLNKHLDTIDTARTIKRRLQYRRFIHQVRYMNDYQDTIAFSNVLQLIPLYTAYLPRDCLGIDEYVRNVYYIGKVDKFLKNERNFDVLNMVVTAWKYRHKNTKAKLVESSFVKSKETFVDELQRSPLDLNGLNTPLMDYGVDDFMWSPRAHPRKTENRGTKHETSEDDETKS